MKPPYPMILVCWNDAHYSGGMAEDLDVEHAPKLTYSLGFQIRKDRKGVTLAQDCYDKGKDYHTFTFIPRGMVVSITKVTSNSD